jgi:hypothetical protein
MRDRDNDDQFRPEEIEQRLKKVLRGAFAGPPTPLKDIPKKTGESRVVRRGAASAASARTAKRRRGNRA